MITSIEDKYFARGCSCHTLRIEESLLLHDPLELRFLDFVLETIVYIMGLIQKHVLFSEFWADFVYWVGFGPAMTFTTHVFLRFRRNSTFLTFRSEVGQCIKCLGRHTEHLFLFKTMFD
jgi:hypothetical protein